MKQGQQAAVAQQIKLNPAISANAWARPRRREAFSAFLQKRKPDFGQFN